MRFTVATCTATMFYLFIQFKPLYLHERNKMRDRFQRFQRFHLSLNFKIMIYINLKDLRMRQQIPMSLPQLAKHYGVDLFDLNNFIWSHKGRNGVYPVDGSRSRAPVKSVYQYPDKLSLVNKLKHKSAMQVAKDLGLPHAALYRYIHKLGIKIK